MLIQRAPRVVQEIQKESFAALREARWLLAALLVAVALAFGAERLLRRRLGTSVQRWTHAAALASSTGAGLWLAWQQRFLCDDAFISFRYARNLVEGNGLVWNKGQWVEGYTNFLWTVLLAGFHALGADIPLTALLGCLASFMVALFASAATVRQMAPSRAVFPFSAMALAGSLPFHTHATSGLETMPAAALVVCALHASTRKRGAFLAGLLFTAASLMRPDHLLFYACFGLALPIEDLLHGRQRFLRRLDFRRYAAYLASFFLIFVPYYLLRWRAYGDFYPNTYYAKSANLAYWKQGFVYAAHFAGSSGAWAWIPALALALVGRARARNETRLRLFALLSVPVFAAYVMKVGGDFMEYRFFVSLLPVVAVACEVGLRWKLRGQKAPWAKAPFATAAALAAAATVVPVHLVPVRGIRWGISREPSFYKIRTVWPVSVDCAWEGLGKQLKRELYDRGLEPPIAAAAVGLLGYYSRLPIVDALGLTNRAIGHKPIRSRSRPGHEKVAGISELIAQGAVLDVGRPGDPSFADARELRLGTLRLTFLRFDPEWAAAIGRIRGAQLPQPERDVDILVHSAPRERVLAALGFYRAFLTGHPLRAPLMQRLEQRLGAVSDFEGEFPGGTKVSGKGLRMLQGDPPPGASGEGWLSSLPDFKGGVGRIEIPIAPLAASELRFALGGALAEKLTVDLVIDGTSVRHATPSGAPGLSPVLWPITDLTGKSGALVIEDANPAPGKGLVVDAIHFGPTTGDVRERIDAAHGEFTHDTGELLREARALLPESDPDRTRLESLVAVRFSLDSLPPGATLSGTAFGSGPDGKTPDDQDPVKGMEGTGCLNSAHGGDAARGRVALPDFQVPSEPILVLVGGGRRCDKVYVGLEVEGRVVSRLCGQNDQTLRREQLQTGPFAGKRGRIVIADEADGAWGHILVDDIVVPRQ